MKVKNILLTCEQCVCWLRNLKGTHAETGQDFWNRGSGLKHKARTKMKLFREEKN